MSQPSLQTRFEDGYVPEPNSVCWLWIKSNDGCSGYGRITSDGLQKKAHRVSYELHKGKIPHGLCVCHRCDTPACVNPDHLFLGTPLDNARDRDRKRRRTAPKGEKVWKAILTPEEVKDILLSEDSNVALAKRYGVSPSTISKIKTKDNWRHLDTPAVSNSRLVPLEKYDDIKRACGSLRSIARQFGITHGTVKRIRDLSEAITR